MDPDTLSPLMRRLGRAPLWSPTVDTLADLGPEVVRQLLPHRAPFLFVDRIVACDKRVGRVVAVHDVDAKDPVFAGHFPGDPVWPGVLLVEALGQAGLCALQLREGGATPATARVTRVHHAVFFAPVRPGDQVELLASVGDTEGYTCLLTTQARRGDTLLAAAVVEVLLG